MHDAYQLHSLLKLSHQVECITAHGDTLLVGTRQGFLFMYNLEKKEPQCELTLMRYNKAFSKKPIQQLEVLPKQNLLFSLTDHLVQLHDLNSINFNTLDVIQKAKGATFFAVSSCEIVSTTGVSHTLIRVAVVVKRKIQLYCLKKNQFLPLSDDVSLTDIPKSMVWCQNILCLGYRDEYALLSLTEKKQTDLFPTSSAKAADPCIVLVSDTHFALCRENQMVLVNTEGKTEKNQSFEWSEPPVYLAHDEPYTLGILTDCIQVCSLEPCKPVQTLKDMPKVRFLVRASSGLLFAASLSQIWCLKGVDNAQQQGILINSKEFQLALKLIQVSDESEDEKKVKIHQVQTLFAYDLFAKKQFAESMREFLKLMTDPYDVIRLYPNMVPQAQQEEVVPDNKDLTDKEVEDSIAALSDYLMAVRSHVLEGKTFNGGNETKKINKSTNQLLKIIDTTLVKCYLQNKDAMVAQIIRENYVHFSETEKILKQKQKYNDLIILYQTKGQHRKALELLQSEKSIEEDSVEKTVKYLQKLGTEDIGLILEFADWVLKKDPEKGLKVFTTEDLAEVQNLPRPRILDMLLKEHPDLAIPYLEHVIHTWKDNNPLYHNTLVHQYREKILKDGPAQSDHTRTKLLHFLEKSTNYTAENVLKDFPTNSLLEERALILGRLGRHDQAIALYVRALGDIKKAEEYCKKMFHKGASGQNVYVLLISLILKPDSCTLNLPGVTLSPRTSQPDLEKALQLLEDNASNIDPVEMLTNLPDEIPVSRIHKFLSVALHNVLQERRQSELLKSLLYTEHLQCQETKLTLQGQHVLITDLNVCPVCKKRFANQAALIRYPNGDVVHYACHREK